MGKIYCQRPHMVVKNCDQFDHHFSYFVTTLKLLLLSLSILVIHNPLCASHH